MRSSASSRVNSEMLKTFLRQCEQKRLRSSPRIDDHATVQGLATSIRSRTLIDDMEYMVRLLQAVTQGKNRRRRVRGAIPESSEGSRNAPSGVCGGPCK